MLQLDRGVLEDHYDHLRDRPFFAEIVDFMSVSPAIATCWEGVDAVATVRLMCGITKAREAEPGTVRGDFAMSVQANLVHASDSLETAKVEVKRFFKDDELFMYELVLTQFIYNSFERSQ